MSPESISKPLAEFEDLAIATPFNLRLAKTLGSLGNGTKNHSETLSVAVLGAICVRFGILCDLFRRLIASNTRLAKIAILSSSKPG